MINSYVSSQIIINEFFRRFKPSNDSWINDIYTIIADVIEQIGMQYELLEIKSEIVKIQNGKAKLRFPYNSIFKIVYNCKELNVKNLPKCGCYNKPYNAKMNGSILEVEFDTGEVEIKYYTIRIDEHGYPEIPNVYEVREACVWNIMENWLIQGNTHPTISLQFAMDKKIDTIASARNTLMFPTPREEVDFMNIWLNDQSFASPTKF